MLPVRRLLAQQRDDRQPEPGVLSGLSGSCHRAVRRQRRVVAWSGPTAAAGGSPTLAGLRTIRRAGTRCTCGRSPSGRAGCRGPSGSRGRSATRRSGQETPSAFRSSRRRRPLRGRSDRQRSSSAGAVPSVANMPTRRTVRQSSPSERSHRNVRSSVS